MQAKICHSDEDLYIVGAGQLLMAVWSVAPEMSHMKVLAQAGDRHRSSLRGEKQVFVNVVLDGTPNFSEEVRAEATRHSQRYAPFRAAAAHVICIKGFRGIAVRSFMSTMILLARPVTPAKVFDSMDSASNWLLTYLQPRESWSRESLILLYQSAYRVLRPSTSAAAASP